MTSLPVPVSPVNNTGCEVRATRHTAAKSSRPLADWVTNSGPAAVYRRESTALASASAGAQRRLLIA